MRFERDYVWIRWRRVRETSNSPSSPLCMAWKGRSLVKFSTDEFWFVWGTDEGWDDPPVSPQPTISTVVLLITWVTVAATTKWSSQRNREIVFELSTAAAAVKVMRSTTSIWLLHHCHSITTIHMFDWTLITLISDPRSMPSGIQDYGTSLVQSIDAFRLKKSVSNIPDLNGFKCESPSPPPVSNDKNST